jgi:hypothetical protein
MCKDMALNGSIAQELGPHRELPRGQSSIFDQVRCCSLVHLMSSAIFSGLEESGGGLNVVLKLDSGNDPLSSSLDIILCLGFVRARREVPAKSWRAGDALTVEGCLSDGIDGFVKFRFIFRGFFNVRFRPSGPSLNR